MVAQSLGAASTMSCQRLQTKPRLRGANPTGVVMLLDRSFGTQSSKYPAAVQRGVSERVL